MCNQVVMTLRVFAITRQGLMAMAIAVAALWTCLGMESATRHRVDQDTAATLHTLARLRQSSEGIHVTPARLPGPGIHSGRPALS